MDNLHPVPTGNNCVDSDGKACLANEITSGVITGPAMGKLSQSNVQADPNSTVRAEHGTIDDVTDVKKGLY